MECFEGIMRKKRGFSVAVLSGLGYNEVNRSNIAMDEVFI